MVLTGTPHPWTAPDGAAFTYTEWRPDAPARAAIVAVHGLSGAAIDFEPLGAQLRPHGLATLALELRGQGSDPLKRRRGDLRKLADWFDDLRAFIALVRTLHPAVPLFFYGESMGAALLTRYLSEAPITDQPAGLILASPVVVLPRRPARWQELLFRALLLGWPTLRLNVRRLTKPRPNAPPAYVTRDEAHRKWFETASHRLDTYTIRFFRSLLDLVGGSLDAAPRLRVPALVLAAGHDVFITADRVKSFFDLLGSADKQLALFPESYHLLLHDHDKAEVLARIEAWLLARLSR